MFEYISNLLPCHLNLRAPIIHPRVGAPSHATLLHSDFNEWGLLEYPLGASVDFEENVIF